MSVQLKNENMQYIIMWGLPFFFSKLSILILNNFCVFILETKCIIYTSVNFVTDMVSKSEHIHCIDIYFRKQAQKTVENALTQKLIQFLKPH